MSETITVKAVWAFFEGEEKPELLFAWDTKEVEGDEDGFKDACRKAVEAAGDVTDWRVMDIGIPDRPPSPAGRTLFFEQRADMKGFVLSMYSAADPDFEFIMKANKRRRKERREAASQ